MELSLIRNMSVIQSKNVHFFDKICNVRNKNSSLNAQNQAIKRKLQVFQLRHILSCKSQVNTIFYTGYVLTLTKYGMTSKINRTSGVLMAFIAKVCVAA